MQRKFTKKRKWAASDNAALKDGDDDADVSVQEISSSERRPKFRKPKDN